MSACSGTGRLAMAAPAWEAVRSESTVLRESARAPVHDRWGQHGGASGEGGEGGANGEGGETSSGRDEVGRAASDGRQAMGDWRQGDGRTNDRREQPVRRRWHIVALAVTKARLGGADASEGEQP